MGLKYFKLIGIFRNRFDFMVLRPPFSFMIRCWTILSLNWWIRQCLNKIASPCRSALVCWERPWPRPSLAWGDSAWSGTRQTRSPRPSQPHWPSPCTRVCNIERCMLVIHHILLYHTDCFWLNLLPSHHWRIQDGSRDASLLPGPIYFLFIQFSAKILAK